MTGGLPPPFCCDCCPLLPSFTHDRCPGGAGKCHSQISQRSRSGAGPYCLWWANKFAIRLWAGRWEQGHRPLSWCENETQSLGKGLEAPLRCPSGGHGRTGELSRDQMASRALLIPAAPQRNNSGKWSRSNGKGMAGWSGMRRWESLPVRCW